MTRIINNPIVQTLALVVFILFVGIGIGAAFDGRGWQAVLLLTGLLAAMILGACVAGEQITRTPGNPRRQDKPHRLDVMG